MTKRLKPEPPPPVEKVPYHGPTGISRANGADNLDQAISSWPGTPADIYENEPEGVDHAAE